MTKTPAVRQGAMSAAVSRSKLPFEQP